MSQGGHSEPLLLLALFYQSTPSCLKVRGGWGGGWGGGPCDSSVSPSPFGLDFGTLDFGTSDLGLTILILLDTHNLSVRQKLQYPDLPKMANVAMSNLGNI